MAVIRAPFIVNLNITDKCNLDCVYCYEGSSSGNRIGKNKILDLIDEFILKHRVFHITIAGGEPLFHPGIIEILSEIYRKYPQKIQLLTNGNRFCDNQFFPEFRDLVLELEKENKYLNIQVSLDSHIPEINDKQRSEGEKTLKALDRLINLPVNLQIACVVTTNNIDIADQIIDRFYPDIRNFHFMNLIPSANRNREIYHLIPSDEELKRFHERILLKEKKYPDIRVTKVVRECDDDEGFVLQVKGCYAGTTRIDIEPNLDIKACCMSDEVLGNLAEQEFDEIWFSDKAEAIRNISTPLCEKWSELHK